MKIFIALVITSLLIISCKQGEGDIDNQLKRNSTVIEISGIENWKETQKFDVAELEVNTIGRGWQIPFRSPALNELMPTPNRYGFQMATRDDRISRVYCVDRLPIDSILFFDTALPEGFNEYDLFYTHIILGEEMNQRAWFFVLPTPAQNEERLPKEGFLSNLDTVYTVKELRSEEGSTLKGYQFEIDETPVAAIIIGSSQKGYIDKSLSDHQHNLFKSAFASVALKTSGYSVFITDRDEMQETELETEPKEEQLQEEKQRQGEL